MFTIIFFLVGCIPNKKEYNCQINKNIVKANLEIEFVFSDKYRGINILKDKKENLINKVGNPSKIIDMGYNKFVHSLGGEKLPEQKYIYPNFEVIFIGEIIANIIIRDNKYKTEKNIGIGSTTRNIIAVYGDVADYVYQDYESMFSLYFEIDNKGQVCEIGFAKIYD